MEINNSQEYEAELRACRKCAADMAKHKVDPTCSDERVVPRPIVLPLKARPFMLIGQAPGLTEYKEGKPFSGEAGKSIRRLFSECGCSPVDFERLVHTSAIAMCYPGSQLRHKGDRSRREDLEPSSTMISNCSPFKTAQLKIVAPKVIILLGALPLKAYVQWKTGKAIAVPLEEWVGRVDDWQGRRVIALAHTSGLATWVNKPDHKVLQDRAKRLLAAEFAVVCQSAGI